MPEQNEPLEPAVETTNKRFISSESLKHRRLFRVGIFVMGESRNLFSDTFRISATFQTVEGLLSGAAVVINGIKVGSVTDVQLVLDTVSKVQVDMVIEEKYRDMIHTSSVAAISQLG